MTTWKKGIDNTAFETLPPQSIINMKKETRATMTEKLLYMVDGDRGRIVGEVEHHAGKLIKLRRGQKHKI